MEGVVFSLKDCVDLMTGLRLPVTEVRVTGGGARSHLWRQLQADVFGLPVHRTRIDEGPAFGAALLAGVAAGVYADVFEASALVQPDPEVNQPDPALNRLYQGYHKAYTDLYRSSAPVMHTLAELSSQK
jgi:xylulokinase